MHVHVLKESVCAAYAGFVHGIDSTRLAASTSASSDTMSASGGEIGTDAVNPGCAERPLLATSERHLQSADQGLNLVSSVLRRWVVTSTAHTEWYMMHLRRLVTV